MSTGTKLTTQQKQNQQLDRVRQKMALVKDRLFEGAPRHISPNRMMTTALMAIRENPDLLDCSIDSLFAAVRQAAFYGWEIGGPVSQAYMVPFRNSKKGTREVTLIPGYRGLIDLARRSGEVLQIDCESVHQCDRFKVLKGDNAGIYHEPSDDPKRKESPITHVYVIVHMRGGAKQRSVWSAAEIDYHKEQYSQGWKKAESSGKKDSPWHTHWETMSFKTIMVALVKRGLIPISGEIRESIDRDESVSGMTTPALEISPAATISEDLPRQLEDHHGEDTAEEQPAQDDGVAEEIFLAAQQAIDTCESLQAVADTIKACLADMPEDDAVKLAEHAERRREAIRQSRGDKQ